MIGAIIGDIAGSKFEFNNCKRKDFGPLIARDCYYTDDTVLTVAVADAIMKARGSKEHLKNSISSYLRWYGRRYPDRGYGGSFQRWLYSLSAEPYNSFGNGAAMRVSPVAYAAESLDECKELSDIVTGATHNHELGLEGAREVAVAIWMARHGKSVSDIKNASSYRCGRLDDIRPTYRFSETCMDTVPVALEAFYESRSFEDAIRNAISVGGDSDTIAAITGSVAAPFYGIGLNDKHSAAAIEKLDFRLSKITKDFYENYHISC